MGPPKDSKHEETGNGRDSPWERDFCPKRRPDLRTRIIDGETVVLDRREQFVHQFNPTASYIWEHCCGAYTPDEITIRLCRAFAVDFPRARRDVLATLERLRDVKLLESR